MSSVKTKILVMATKMEASPFIEELGLRKTEGAPFPVFQNQDTLLVISGIGKTHAAMAATFCCLIHSPGILYNLGAAGALDETLALGEVLQVSRILEPDRPDFKTSLPMVLLPDTFPDFKSVTVATQDRPMLSPDERKEVSRYASLADMEAASVVQVCKQFQTPCHVFKFVSDTPAHDRTEDIVTNIRAYRGSFFDFIHKNVLNHEFEI